MATLQNGIEIFLEDKDGVKTDNVVINSPYRFIFYTRYDTEKATASSIHESDNIHIFPEGVFGDYEWVEFEKDDGAYVRINTGDLFNIASQGPNAGRELDYNPVMETEKSPLWPYSDDDAAASDNLIKSGNVPRYTFKLFQNDDWLVHDCVAITRQPRLPRESKFFLTRFTANDISGYDNPISEDLTFDSETHHDLVTYYDKLRNFRTLFFKFQNNFYQMDLEPVINRETDVFQREILFNNVKSVLVTDTKVLSFLKYIFSITRLDVSDKQYKENINGLVAGEIKKMNKEEYRKDLDNEVKERLRFDEETIRKEREKVIQEHRDRRNEAERKIRAIEDELLKE